MPISINNYSVRIFLIKLLCQVVRMPDRIHLNYILTKTMKKFSYWEPKQSPHCICTKSTFRMRTLGTVSKNSPDLFNLLIWNIKLKDLNSIRVNTFSPIQILIKTRNFFGEQIILYVSCKWYTLLFERRIHREKYV